MAEQTGNHERHLTRAAAEFSEGVTFAFIVIELAAAGARLARLGEVVRSTHRYVETCAAGCDRLAEQMAALNVDADTVAEHHEAAALMRQVLAEAEEMASHADELGSQFTYASEAHQRDYGSVNDAANNMPTAMADAEFYSNR